MRQCHLPGKRWKKDMLNFRRNCYDLSILIGILAEINETNTHNTKGTLPDAHVVYIWYRFKEKNCKQIRKLIVAWFKLRYISLFLSDQKCTQSVLFWCNQVLSSIWMQKNCERKYWTLCRNKRTLKTQNTVL